MTGIHRRVRLRFSAALFVAVAAVLVATGYAQISRGSARDFSATALTGLPFRGWPTNGGNLYNQRYSPLKAINRDNVAQLKGVWRTRLRGSGAAPRYSGFAQPLVSDGVAYVSTGANDVFALSIDTRRNPLAVRGEHRPHDHVCLLRLEQQGRGAQREHGVHRAARWQARGDRARDRQGGVVDPGRALAGQLLDHLRPCLLRRHGDHRLCRRRQGDARPRQSVRRARRAARLDVLHDPGSW